MKYFRFLSSLLILGTVMFANVKTIEVTQTYGDFVIEDGDDENWDGVGINE